jgi:hypothetical protein
MGVTTLLGPHVAQKHPKKTIKHLSEAITRVYTVENRFKHGPSELVKTGY